MFFKPAKKCFLFVFLVCCSIQTARASSEDTRTLLIAKMLDEIPTIERYSNLQKFSDEQERLLEEALVLAISTANTYSEARANIFSYFHIAFFGYLKKNALTKASIIFEKTAYFVARSYFDVYQCSISSPKEYLFNLLRYNDQYQQELQKYLTEYGCNTLFFFEALKLPLSHELQHIAQQQLPLVAFAYNFEEQHSYIVKHVFFKN